MSQKRPTAERVREMLDYDPETGVFTWKAKNPRSRIPIGAVAGANMNGYRVIILDMARYRAHHLAWLHVYGVWPEHGIDHRNRQPSDNRIANLREATQDQNMQNLGKPRTNTSGYQGVSKGRHGTGWRAAIHHDGRRINLGTFKTPEEASAAYVRAKTELHPFWEPA
jgi:hypothetical protein